MQSFDLATDVSFQGSQGMPGSTGASSWGIGNPFVSYCQKTPFQKNLFVYLESGVVGTPLEIEVPANKMLVIEFLSAQAYMESVPGQFAMLRLITDFESQKGEYYLLLTRAGTDDLGRDTFIGSQTMRAYASPGTTVTINVIRNSSQGFCNFDLTVSGFLQDVNCYSPA